MDLCFKCSTAEEAIKNLEEHIEEIDSMVIYGKIAAERSTKIIVKSKIKKSPR